MKSPGHSHQLSAGRKLRAGYRSLRAGYRSLRAGYVMMEIVIALGLFSAVAVSLVKALHMTSLTASTIQNEMQIERILRSAMTDAISTPNLEEGRETVDLTEITGDEMSFFTGQVETIVEPMELENEDGQLLQKMFRIEVIFYWQVDGEWRQQSAETWRYANLYQP
ncbi:MAG: hypothetical protein KJO21_13075 [Verrucomicrobiae bacterium]|nr:hypothetical protein [Verrucomicrobiae bacterium]NNJ44239.1 hypothetical protein [Akkermansiaceae bacterium]